SPFPPPLHHSDAPSTSRLLTPLKAWSPFKSVQDPSLSGLSLLCVLRGWTWSLGLSAASGKRSRPPLCICSPLLFRNSWFSGDALCSPWNTNRCVLHPQFRAQDAQASRSRVLDPPHPALICFLYSLHRCA
ncbi:hypothetical protein EXIGLDRAFT_844551, partial [Exidia glandulosa HHB12029]